MAHNPAMELIATADWSGGAVNGGTCISKCINMPPAEPIAAPQSTFNSIITPPTAEM